MDTLVASLKATTISQAIAGSVWIWPLCEMIHFIGLTLVIGVVGAFDLRLMGFIKRVPLRALRDLLPLAVGGFVLNLTTGLIFFVGLPEQYVHNPAWWAKMSFLGVAGLNALLFELAFAKRTLELAGDDKPPAAARLIGAVSLVSWVGVLYWGRMLPFLGGSF